MIDESASFQNIQAVQDRWVAGADGFKSQWCVVLKNLATGELRTRLVPNFLGLLHLNEKPQVVTVDIPIGLPEFTTPGGRKCETEARPVLRSPRASSVFNAVGRGALRAKSRIEAGKLSRSSGGLGIGAQAWGLAAKLNEADLIMTQDRQSLVYEVHPEVSFWAMSNKVAMGSSKKSAGGAQERMCCLASAGFAETAIRSLLSQSRAGRDDLLDAFAAVWTAERILKRTAGRLPHAPVRDGRGLDQAIWF